ncbi:hypothetical protein HPB51_003084 [Rhipicephalus microplus]|uniref:Uncharacterized protein n=1 Tax=Rhipicephalus microplus TaxID=6941 RepID=A0A9J6EEV0_RHIMP|nr:hypothetical protein HPB51_003084 [Rhipicephalus microplus]
MTRMAEMEKSRMPRLHCRVILTARRVQWRWWAGAIGGRAQRPLPCVELKSPSSASCIHSTTSTHHSAGLMATIKTAPLYDEDEAAACTTVRVQLPFVVFPLIATSSERGEHGEGAASFMVTRMSGDVATPALDGGAERGELCSVPVDTGFLSAEAVAVEGSASDHRRRLVSGAIEHISVVIRSRNSLR